MEEPGSEEELPEEEDSRAEGELGPAQPERSSRRRIPAARKRHILFIAGYFLSYFIRFMLYKCKKGENLPFA
jgi:hypothetical protein